MDRLYKTWRNKKKKIKSSARRIITEEELKGDMRDGAKIQNEYYEVVSTEMHGET
jgi:hypothetical protein